MKELVESLVRQGILRTQRIIDAFYAINREDFVPSELQELAQIDHALPIAAGQTISQPLVVAFMLEKLGPKEGENILDIGSGSGWTTTLLSHIVGTRGKVTGIEIIPELTEFGRKNIAKYDSLEKGTIQIVCTNAAKGYTREAPFDKILVSASLAKKEIPIAWKNQLKVNGRIVVPIRESIWLFTKTSKDTYSEEEYPGFVFVPFQNK